MKINLHIEIVRTTERGLSSMSQRSSDAILRVLKKYYTRVGVTIINDLSDLDDLVRVNPDLVFLGMKYLPRNKSVGMNDPDKLWIADFLEENNILCTGSRSFAHELELNKQYAKRRLLDLGLNTSSYFVTGYNDLISDDKMLIDYPLFVKPANRGGGLGIDSDSLVHDFSSLKSKVRAITKNLQSDSLVEEYLPGREFSVAILKDKDTSDLLAMPIELVADLNAQGESILSSEIKQSNTEKVIKVTDEIIKSEVIALAINAFQALGARDYGRIDIRLDKHGVPHFLEANLIPSIISGYGSFPKACVLNSGIQFTEMILSIVELGLTRNIEIDEEAPQSMLLPLSVPIVDLA